MAPDPNEELVIILHTSIDPDDPCELGTWGWFKKHEADLSGWSVLHLSLDRANDFDYADNIAARWGRDDLLTWERDNLPAHPLQLHGLATCPEPVCAIDYEMVRCLMVEVRDVRTRAGLHPHALVCARHQQGLSMMRDFDGRTDPGTWTHAPNPPLGLTRFRWEAQQRIGAFPRERWPRLDVAVARAMKEVGLQAHIHRPRAVHHHRFRPEEHVHPAFAERKERILRLAQLEPGHRAQVAKVAGLA